MSYIVKLSDIKEERNFLVRFVEIKGFPWPSYNFKISRWHEVNRQYQIPLREVIVETTVSKLVRIGQSKDVENEEIEKLNKKFYDTVNVHVLIPLVKIDEEKFDLGNILNIINDIYYSNSRVTFFTPPKFYVEDMNDDLRSKIVNIFRSSIEHLSNITRKPFYLLPVYLTGSEIDNIIEIYGNKFGYEGFYVTDCAGSRFSSGCYRFPAAIMRNMKQKKIEDYGLYLFDSKPYKRASERAPSEEFLAILSGVNIIGRRHTNTPIQPDVAEKIKQNNISIKVFNKLTLFYEKSLSFKDYDTASIESDSYIIEELRDEFNKGSDIKSVISTKNDFLKELGKVLKDLNKVKNNASLISFL